MQHLWRDERLQLRLQGIGEETLGIIENQNLFGESDARIARVVTFTDEIKPGKDSDWAYISLLSVKQADLKVALSRLSEDRRRSNQHHEIGWTDLSKKGGRVELARRWLTRLAEEDDIWRFSILGIDTKTLSCSTFGEKTSDQRANYYRRFYRATVAQHLSALTKKHGQVHVVKCYHDKEGRLESDAWFSWHPLAKVESQVRDIQFLSDRVTFVNSDHNTESEHPCASHFIQVCDVLAGATRYAFEGLNQSEGRDRAVEPFLPLLERLNCNRRCRNPNSSYGDLRRATLSFFPSRALNEQELLDPFIRAQSTFFKNRRMALIDAKSGQGLLELGV